MAGSGRHSFNPTLGAVLHPGDVKARSLCLVLAATLAAASAPSLAHATPVVAEIDATTIADLDVAERARLRALLTRLV